MTSSRPASPAVRERSVRRYRLRGYTIALGFVLALSACTPDAADPTTTTTTSPSGTPASTTTAPPTDEGEEAGVSHPGIEREVWRALGEVIPGGPYNGLADIKIGQFGDGSYVAIVNTGPPPRQVVFTSPDLVEWSYVRDLATDHEEFFGALLTMDDGRVRAFYTVAAGVDHPDRTNGVTAVGSMTTADGVTWVDDEGFRLDSLAFDRDVWIEILTIVPRAEGGWRMYIQVIDCEILALDGTPNCDDPDAPRSEEGLVEGDPGYGGCGCQLKPIYSAVSDDMMVWTPESGVRYDASWENGSFGHPHAWIGSDGRVRISSQMDVPPALGDDEGRNAFGTIISNDGLSFDTYDEQPIIAVDPYIVEVHEGFLMFTSSGGEGIRVWDLVTVNWEIGPAVFAAEVADFESGGHTKACHQFEIRGEGTFTLDVRGGGELQAGGRSEWTPHSASPYYYELESDVVEAPTTVSVWTWEHPEVFGGLPPGSPEIPWQEWAGQLVATDQDGIQSWLIIHRVGQPVSGHSC